MKINDNPNLTEGFFAGDNLGGSVNLECSKCKFIFKDISKPDESCFCPKCKTELFYRSWWEW